MSDRQIRLIMKIIAFDFVIKHKARKFNFVDASFKRFDYQNINIEITKLLSTFQKKLSMIDSLNADVITRIRTLCAAVSRNFRFKNASFEIEFLKNLKNETFKLILFHVKKIEKHDVVLNVFRVIAITLTNDEKIFDEKSSKFIYKFIVTLQQKNEFVKIRFDEFAKTTQRKNDRFFKSLYFLNKNELLRHHNKIYVFDETFVHAVLLKRYHDDELTKHFETNKTVELLARKYY